MSDGTPPRSTDGFVFGWRQAIEELDWYVKLLKRRQGNGYQVSPQYVEGVQAAAQHLEQVIRKRMGNP